MPRTGGPGCFIGNGSDFEIINAPAQPGRDVDLTGMYAVFLADFLPVGLVE